MENNAILIIYYMRRVIFFAVLIVIIVSIATISKQASSFDTYVAHPHLTEAAINLFNQKAGNKINDEEKQNIIQGSIDEDTPARWMNHFYNPNTNKGLYGFSSAKKWVNYPDSQEMYAVGDQSWDAALYAYADNDYNTAFLALGHVLHLIEDMAVPAHTRLDSHPEGDPLESWAEKYNPGFAREDIEYYDNLDAYFYNLASISNNNFFSEDTIDKKDINLNNIKGVIYSGVPLNCVQELYDNKKYCKIAVEEDLVDSNNNKYFITDKINSDYYSILAPKAVSYAAGVIQLFFEQGEATRAKHDAIRAKYNAYTNALTKLFINQNGKLVSAVDLLKNPQTSQKVADVIIQSVNKTQAETTKEIIKILTPATTTKTADVLGEKIIPPLENDVSSATSTTDDSVKTIYLFTGSPAYVFEPWPALIFDSIFSSTLYTSSTLVSVFGECASGTQSIFVYRSAESSSTPDYMANATTTINNINWSSELIPQYGINLYYFSALGDDGRPTSSAVGPAQIILDYFAPSSTALAAEIISTSTTSTVIHLNLSAEENISVPVAYDLDFSASGTEWANLLSVSTSTFYDFTATSSGDYVFRLRASDALGNVSDYVFATTTVELGPIEYEYIHLSGEQIDDELILTATGSPYILEHYIVPAGKILRLQPGTIVKGLNRASYMEIYGSMYVEGAGSGRVAFTSVQDRSFGDDRTNTMTLGTNNEPAAWDWGGLIFYGGSYGEINYADFRYSGSDPFLCLTARATCGFYSKTIYAGDGVILSIDNSTFSYGGNLYIKAEFYQSIPEANSISITNTIFDGANSYSNYGSGIGGIYIVRGALHLDNVQFLNLEYGIYSDSRDWNWPAITINNVSSANFINVTTPVYPEGILTLE